MPPNTRSQKREAAKNQNYTPAGPKVYASEDIPSSQQATSPDSPSIPLYQRSTKWMKGALTPLNTRVEHEEDSPAPVKTDSLDVSQVENLKDHLLELKRKVQLQIGEIEEKVSLETLAPMFFEKHQEYMDDIKQLVEVCQCRIGQAADSGERRITGPIDIGSRLLSRTTKPLVRKRLDSLTEQPTPKKACLAETNRIVEDTEDTPMESSANTQHERQHPSRAILTHSSPPYDSVTSSPNPDTSGMSLADQATPKKDSLAERYPRSEGISDRSVESDSNIQCDQPRISLSTQSNASPISSHHSITPAAAREVSVEASSSYSPLPSSLDIPQTQLSEERKELPVSDDDPPDDDPPEALTIEKAVLNPKSPLSPNGLPPSNAHSSSHNVPITPQPAEKTLNPDLPSPHEDSTKEKRVFHPEPPLFADSTSHTLPTMPLPAENASNPDRSSHNLPTTTHPAEKASIPYPSSDNVPMSTHPAEKASNPESSSPHEVITKEKPLFHPESPLSIHDLPLPEENASNPDRSSLNLPTTTHPAGKASIPGPSSDNVTISTHPAEKASNPESSSPHEVITKEKPLFHPESPLSIHDLPLPEENASNPDRSSPNLPTTTHPAGKASNPESSSSNPQEVVTKEKPLFRPESPLSIHNLPPSNPHSYTQSSPVTTHQEEKTDHALPLSTSEDSDKVHHGGQDKDGQNDGKQEMVDGQLLSISVYQDCKQCPVFCLMPPPIHPTSSPTQRTM
ncbi:hypothetical protein PGT21_000368 [Puccinia graminis f. sp. tritici]|uniref:Uncharacterized protein n=1 Tax=Puccinia graminis f. sp. tritici TaxID=56615 RepID=A0A5B0N6T5_PUCGR|nr:hypothetical protein PGT21_000368 [Puccinia graminis f. sp. tritici]